MFMMRLSHLICDIDPYVYVRIDDRQIYAQLKHSVTNLQITIN